jgi:hypothetical protein
VNFEIVDYYFGHVHVLERMLYEMDSSSYIYTSLSIYIYIWLGIYVYTHNLRDNKSGVFIPSILSFSLNFSYVSYFVTRNKSREIKDR